jgi:hypothetical protein
MKYNLINFKNVSSTCDILNTKNKKKLVSNKIIKSRQHLTLKDLLNNIYITCNLSKII